MIYMLGHSIKRLFREGAKSLSVPLIAMVLAILINLLGGIRAWLENQYEDTMNNFPVIAVVSDLTGTQTDDLQISMRYIDVFTDPDVHFSLARQTGDVAMKRTVENAEITGHPAQISLTGISHSRADSLLNPDYGAEITFFEGYDETNLASEDLVCIVSYELYDLAQSGILHMVIVTSTPDIITQEPIFPDDAIIEVSYYYTGNEPVPVYTQRVPIEGMEDIRGAYEYIRIYPEYETVVTKGERFEEELELTVIGVVHGAGHGLVYSPFWAISRITEELTGIEPFTESLSVRVADNKALSGFKSNAAMSFSRVSPIYDSRPFAMLVYDSEFYETLEPLRQNIIVVDVATPFIYILSIAVGFLTSVLLTRRRKAEFAIMRSVGVNKWTVFVSALAEQALLSLIGVTLGFAFVAVIWGYTDAVRPAVFFGCYLLGAVFASVGAAGTNVMKVLRDRRE